ncbi:hypothetical protein [Caballeronia sp. AZ1_KS37]|uniref:hypothetical protein n=1 Tax=Caballeronia sp. AZ1_KS37 TaxID=2921756 RepID=UPI002029176F|nr:hypothetical protein [Caballeronia sp. AZ1_KS37]
MLNVYIGATFQMVGGLQKDGAPSDFSGWTLTANLYDQTGSTLLSNLNTNWLDITQGLLTLTAPDTSSWPAGKARIDCQLVTPSGEIVLGPPTYLRILQSPLS